MSIIVNLILLNNKINKQNFFVCENTTIIELKIMPTNNKLEKNKKKKRKAFHLQFWERQNFLIRRISMRSSKTTNYYKSFYCDISLHLLRGLNKSVNGICCLHIIVWCTVHTQHLFIHTSICYFIQIHVTENYDSFIVCLPFWQKTTTFNELI